MPERIGPHLLGRIYVADERDWKIPQLLLLEEHAQALTKNSTLTEVRQGAGQFWGWRYWEALWKLVKALFGSEPTPTPPPTPTGDVDWADPQRVLDQGDYGTCVGNGWAQWGNTLPVGDTFDELDARAIYYEATVIDGSPDDPDAPGGGQEGSTVRSGAKAMRARGRLAAFAFAGFAEMLQWVRTRGPVTIGSDWTNAMFTPDPQGFIFPDGDVVGGHCYLLVGWRAPDVLVFLNSWGASWGDGGRFYMHETDFEELLGHQGEACVSLELAA